MERRRVVGVMGGHAADPANEAVAEEVGRRIAQHGWILLNGGRNQGIMAASARGCRQAGGLSVGVHPDGRDTDDIAPDLDLVIHTGVGFARNAINILSSDAILALKGGPGTLAELAYAQIYRCPTVLLGFDDRGWFDDRFVRARDIDHAFELLETILEGPKRTGAR